MEKAYLFFGLSCILLAGLVMVECFFRLGIGSLKAPDAGFWPFIIAIIFMGLSLSYVVTILRSKVNTLKSFWGKVKWGKPLIILVLLFLYGMVLEKIGFILTTFIFMLVLFRVHKPQRWILVVGGALLSSLGMYAVFELWLRAGLPRSPWGYF